jgi:deoxycytidylate deaminase
MSAVPITKESRQGSAGESIIDVLHTRASKEFVLGLMGAVGCGLPRVVTGFETALEKLGYKVVRIKISAFITEQIKQSKVSVPADEEKNRYLANQTAGNTLRGLHGNDVMAKFVINQIGRHRIAINPALAEVTSELPRIAYIVDQIKHPDEVALLRTVYRNNFYLVGVMSLEENRKSRLKDEGFKQPDIDKVIKRDRKEIDKSGQQLEKAFKLADYFMHNPLGDKGDDLVGKQIERFLDLTHGSNTITPTAHEHAMYIAFSTAMKSSCLSRQVGASITDKYGRVIAVGTNDVPRYKGGLYGNEHKNDDRCFKTRKLCENNAEKLRRKDAIKRGVEKYIVGTFPEGDKMRDEKNIEKMSELIYEQSGIPDLIEFSRAVHAEMDALISLSRGGGGSTVGSTLYATTFPCHNCARHIIAAGVDKVYYIEPYEKSLAPTSHDDAIIVLDHDEDENEDEDEDEEKGKAKAKKVAEKLRFVHFSGVGPRMYPELFQKESRKTGDGRLLTHADSLSEFPIKVVQEFIDPYRSFEVKVADLFEQEFSTQLTLIK